MNRALWIVGWAAIVVGAAVALTAVVVGMASSDVGVIYLCLLPELAGCGLLIVGIHALIEADRG